VVQCCGKWWRGGCRYPWLLLTGLGLSALGSFLLAVNLWAEYHFRAAGLALQQRDFTQARAHLGPCLKLWPTGPRTHFLAARTAWRSGCYDEAEEHLRVCQRQEWAADALRCERALMQAQRGDRSAEDFLWSRVQQDDPDTALILEVLIQDYVSTYRLTRALDALNLFLQRQPNDIQALLGRGWVWEQFFHFANAAEDYHRAVEVDPENDAARLRLAETLVVTGPASAALDHFEHLRQRQPEKPAVLLGLARCRRQLGQLNDARCLLDGLLAHLPPEASDKNAAVLSERGRVALDEGKLAEAESWLRQAAALAPYDRQANYSLYQCLEQQGHTDQAGQCKLTIERIDADLKRIDELLKEVLRTPYDPSLRSEVGIIFLRNGDPEKGLRWLYMALQQDPRHEPTHRALVNYYERNGRLDLAARHLQLAQWGNLP
jgi:tetratricopeptide (TPR) repeat protein